MNGAANLKNLKPCVRHTGNCKHLTTKLTDRHPERSTMSTHDNLTPKDVAEAKGGVAVRSSVLLACALLFLVSTLCQDVVIYHHLLILENHGKAISRLQEQLSHPQSVSTRQYGESDQPSASSRTDLMPENQPQTAIAAALLSNPDGTERIAEVTSWSGGPPLSLRKVVGRTSN